MFYDGRPGGGKPLEFFHRLFGLLRRLGHVRQSSLYVLFAVLVADNLVGVADEIVDAVNQGA